MKGKTFKKITSSVLVFAMVFGMFGQNALAMSAETAESKEETVVETETEVETETVLTEEPESETVKEETVEVKAVMAADQAATYEFGPNKTVLEPGKYDLPLSMNKYNKPDESSMAGTCIRGAILTVNEDGSASVNVKLGSVSVMGVSGWGSEWQYYTEYGYTNENARVNCEYTEIQQGNESFVNSITFTLPDNSWNGTYMHMWIDVMGSYQDAFFKMDFANAKPHIEKETYTVNFSSGENGSLEASVDGEIIESGSEVVSGKTLQLIAKPNENFGVKSWSGIAASGDYAEVIVDRNLDVSVDFIELSKLNYVVNFKAQDHGSIKAEANGKMLQSGDSVVHGTNVIFTATPDKGYKTQWSGVVGEGNIANVNVTEEISAIASFELIMDRTALDEAIVNAEAIEADKNNYAKDAQWDDLVRTLKIAKNPDMMVNQTQVDFYTEELNNAILSVNKVDRTAIDEQIKRAEASNYKWYDKTVSLPVKDAIDAAKKYYNVQVASQSVLDDASKQIKDTMDKLDAYKETLSKKVVEIVDIEGNVVKQYTTFPEAYKEFDNTKDKTLRLLENSSCIEGMSGKRPELDLNGFKLEVEGIRINTLAANEKGGTLDSIYSIGFNEDTTLGKNITINGEVHCNKILTIDGATLSNDGDTITTDFVYTLDKLIINSGKIISTNGYAINLKNELIPVEIKNGEISGNQYAIYSLGETNITGGKFKGTEGAVRGNVVVPADKKMSSIPDAEGFYSLIAKDTEEKQVDVASIGNKKYKSIVDAFKEVKSGEKIELLADCTVKEYVEISQNCEIDLNGHNLNVNPYNQKPDGEIYHGNTFCAVQINKGVKVDISDSNPDKNGKVSQNSRVSQGTAFIVKGELTAKDITIETLGNAGLFKPVEGRVVLDSVKLSENNESSIITHSNKPGYVELNNITANFKNRDSSIIDRNDAHEYVITKCDFTDDSELRSESDEYTRGMLGKVTMTDTTWTFNKGGRIVFNTGIGAHPSLILNNCKITTNSSTFALKIIDRENTTFTDCIIENKDGFAIETLNVDLLNQTIVSGTYTGKDYAINAIPAMNINGGKFFANKGAINGKPILPNGKTIKKVEDGSYSLVDGEYNYFELADNKDVEVYGPNGKSIGGADLIGGTAPMLFVPNNAKVVLKKDVTLNNGVVAMSRLNKGKYTLDLNGHKINAVYEGSDESYLAVDKGTELTIIDSVGTGEVNLAEATEHGPISAGSAEGTKVIINGGNWNLTHFGTN